MDAQMLEALIDEQDLWFGAATLFNNGNAFITLAVDMHNQTEATVRHSLQIAGFCDVRFEGSLTWFSTNGRSIRENMDSSPADATPDAADGDDGG